MDDKKEKIWQSWMTIVVLSTLVIMVFIFNSQSPSIRSEQNENVSIGNDRNIVDSSASITDNSTLIMDNDTYFKSMVKGNLGVILESLKCISEAGKIKSFDAEERCGKFLSEHSNLSLRHASKYNVSPSLQTALDEYKSALEYYNIGGTKLEIGARDRNLSQMSDAIVYIQNGTAYINRVTDVLYGNETSKKISNTTFVHPRVDVSGR